jgi:hypothetical protein
MSLSPFYRFSKHSLFNVFTMDSGKSQSVPGIRYARAKYYALDTRRYERGH